MTNDASPSTSITETLSPIQKAKPTRKGKLSANVGRLWVFMASSLYKSDDPIVMATREALQNSADAIRAKKGSTDPGRFDVTFDEDARTLTWADNGIGMAESTIFNTFLSLGDSGKGKDSNGNNTDQPDATGGFGIAKAIILGATGDFKWTLRTRERFVSCAGLNEDIQMERWDYHQGASITLRDIPERLDHMYSNIGSKWGTIPERVKSLLELNNLPDVTMRLDGTIIESKFVCDDIFPHAINFGEKNKATCYRIKREDNAIRDSTVIIQLNGLFQHRAYSYQKHTHDFVINIETSNRPGDKEYPFTASRDELKGAANHGYHELMTAIRKDGAARIPREEEVIDADIYSEDEMLSSLSDGVFNDLLLSALRKPSMLKVATKKNEKRDPWDVDDNPVASDAVTSPVSVQHLIEGRVHEMISVVPGTTQNFGSIRINLKNYDADRGEWFKENLESFRPMAMLWSAVLRVIAARCHIGQKFSTGFVLDNNIHGQVIVKKDSDIRVIYLNPDSFLKVQANGAEALAEFLINTGVHELTHVTQRYDVSSHGSDFANQREAFGDEMWAVREVIFHLIERYFPSHNRCLDCMGSGVSQYS